MKKSSRNLLALFDALGYGVLVCEMQSHRSQESRGLGELLAADPQASRIRRELRAAMKRIRANPGLQVVASQLATASARYVIRATLQQDVCDVPLIVAALERRTPSVLCDADLQAHYALTRAEINVARLIARGKTNTEIAEELSISPHTARRHTEKILLKLNVRTRTEIVSRLLA